MDLRPTVVAAMSACALLAGCGHSGSHSSRARDDAFDRGKKCALANWDGSYRRTAEVCLDRNRYKRRGLHAAYVAGVSDALADLASG
jgi:hypothetical protein